MPIALEAGDLVDQKYRIIRFIGRGAWASVYEGVNARIGRRVAIKVLNDEAIQKPGVVDRFEREAQAATRIDSQHVVHVFDLGVLGDGRPYIVMELLEGENLGHQISTHGTLSPARAIFYTIQALRGLADAHAAGVMHRDIKPDNMVLVTTKHGDEVLKIVDFGISKLQSGLQQAVNMTQTNTVLGSPVYMSPEQCRGTKHMDHRSDLYSLGVVLFELLTGQVPHKGETFNELMFKIALEDTISPAVLNPELDPDLCKVVLKALARESSDRFQSALAFEEALIHWATTHGIDTSSWSERRSRLHANDSGDTVTVKSSQRRPGPTQPIELAETKHPTHKPPAAGVVRLVDEGTTTTEPTASALSLSHRTSTAGTTATAASQLLPKKRNWVWAAAALGAVAVLGVVMLFGRDRPARDGATTGRSPMVAPDRPIEPAVSPTPVPTVSVTATPTPEATPTPAATSIASAPVEHAAEPVGHVAGTVPRRPIAAIPSAKPVASPQPPPVPVTSGNSIVDGRRIRTDM